MAKLIPGGFPELTPDKQGLENELREIIKKNYKKYGYISIETPTIESNKILTSKGGDEVSKQIFGLYGLSQGNEDLKDYSLHFDLTVPLARYVVEHENELTFPFKRFAMQKVFRGERQQKGRFKEFMQCDVDVIDENLDLNYDIEVIETLYSSLDGIFNHLGIKKELEVHLNNRKFIDSICEYFGILSENKKDFYLLLDDYYKRSNKEFIGGVYRSDVDGTEVKIKKGLIDIVGKKYEEVLEFLKIDIEKGNFKDEKINTSFNEVKKTYISLKKSGVNVIFDPYITRGLDYYTGTVFETFVTDYIGFGSICSGGRFDNLVGNIRNVTGVKGKKYGGVGGSIGLTRLFSRLMDSDLINKKSSLVETIIFNIPGISSEYRDKVSNILRKEGISLDVYYKSDKLGKQFSYANNKNIPFGIFAGENEEKENKVIIKNLDTRDSFEVDLKSLVKEIKKQLNLIIN